MIKNQIQQLFYYSFKTVRRKIVPEKSCSFNHTVYVCSSKDSAPQQVCLLIKFFFAKNRTFVSVTVYKENAVHAIAKVQTLGLR